MLTPTVWTVVAQNLPEHARNPIHTDAGAQQAGFPAALVAGVTTYAYLTHPIVAGGGGVDWLAHGGGEVRFRAPVFAHDQVRLMPVATLEGVRIDALTAADARARATLTAIENAGPAAPMRSGESLRRHEVRLEGEFGHGYGSRAGDDLATYLELGVVHPAVWPALANSIVHAQVARGSWIHTRSIVRHHALVPVGSMATVDSVVVERFERGGQRAILDVRIMVGGDIVATLEHEAIVDLARRD